MATEEARSLLNALMGGDRNAPLPKGAARPGKRTHGEADTLLLPGKRSKSCHDADICPLYSAWGVDVYDLFVNTKSDLGPNPNVVDADAHAEYLKLPPDGKQALGFDYFLYQKLLELVRQCDRMVQRNKEKLQQELSRKAHVVQTIRPENVDEAAVEQLARATVQAELMTNDLAEKLQELETVQSEEDEKKSQLEPLLLETQETPTPSDNTTETTTSTTDQVLPSNTDDTNNSLRSELQHQLGQLTLAKGKLIYAISRLMLAVAPIQDSVMNQRRQLNYVRSDISTDKTVCAVSGNFMSSRDADERIAAHYAGKQYVGWRLVRDRLAEMQKQYGRYGPPPPTRNNRAAGVAPSGMGRGGGGGFSGGGRGGGGRGGRFEDRRDIDRGGRWERGGPPSFRGGGGGGGPRRF
jgi:hypothetical protein